MKTTELQKQLETKRSRRGEIAADLDATRRELAETQAAVIEGKPKATDAATAARARFEALTGAVSQLDTETAALLQEIERTSEAEQRAQAEQRLHDLAATAAAHREAFEGTLQAASEALQPHVAQLLNEYSALRACRLEFIAVASRLAPGLTELTNRDSRHTDTTAGAPLRRELNDLVTRLEAEHDLAPLRARWNNTPETALDAVLQWRTPEKFKDAIFAAFGEAVLNQEKADQ